MEFHNPCWKRLHHPSPTGSIHLQHSTLPSTALSCKFHRITVIIYYLTVIKHAIVVAYYNALDSPRIEIGDVPEFDSPTRTRTAPFHVRHYFDYLRQTIMCHADTNLEVLDPVNHTTNGWNQDKVCRNYEIINAFAQRWANSTDTGIVT
jgi:hypothetical protein